MDRGGRDLQVLRLIAPGHAPPRIQLPARDPVHLVIGRDELRIEARRAAEDRLAEAQDAGDIIDVVIDMSGQQPALDDPVGMEPVANLQRHPLAIGENIAAAEHIGAGEAIALELVAAVGVGRVGGEGGRGDSVAAIFGLEAVQRADVAGELGLVDAGVIIAEQGIELRPLQAEIEPPLRGGVIAALRPVGIDRIILVRIDDSAKAAVSLAPVAVISERHQPAPLDAAARIERESAIGQPAAVVAAEPLHVAAEAVVADRAFGEAHNGPGPLARIEPGFEPLLADQLAVAEGETERDGAGRRGRLKLDISDAVVALDMPDRAGAFEPGQLPRLLRVGFDRGIIRRRHREVPGEAVMDRAAIAVGQAQSKHRPGDAVGDQQ